MNSENWKTGGDLLNKQSLLENVINSTKIELQNGLRTLMVQIGKVSNKNQQPQADQAQIENLSEKIEANFEKVFLAQNLFIDSCYRLQMDESQIESKISDILEKLIETFDKKTTIEMKDIRNLEKLIKSHDAHITRNLYQVSSNGVTIYEKIIKDHKEFDVVFQGVVDHLNALFALVQDSLVDENGSLLKQNKEDGVEMVVNLLKKQDDRLTNSVGEIKEIVEDWHDKNSSQVINEYFRNISQIITGMEAKLVQQLNQVIAEMNRTSSPESDCGQNQTTTEEINELVAEIFGLPLPGNKTPANYLSTLDVRSNLEPNRNEPAVTEFHNFDDGPKTEGNITENDHQQVLF